MIDGDTLEVRFPDGRTEDVRLLGVDTPEVHVDNDPTEFEGIPETTAGSDWLRDWGHRASEFARAELRGDTVRIAVDPTADRRGGYGRLLVYVYESDGTLFNLALIEQGYARMYDSSFRERSTFEAAEARAQRNDVGLWGYAEATTTTTTDGGAIGGELSIARIRADAPGNDHENLNEEYIVFENTGSATLDLSGWTVRDEADHRYTFPAGTVLEPGEQLTLHTGSGTDTDSDLYWGSGRAIWNNGGDTIIVTTPDGTVVIRETYS